MATSSVELCSQALYKIGVDAIQSFADGTAEADVAAALYPGIRDAVLSAYPWSFATGQRQLARLAQAPIADFEHAFALPEDFLRALSAGSPGRGRGLDYRIADGRLHCNQSEVMLTYIYRPHESSFPPFFNQVLTARLAAEFCIPLTESTSRADSLHKLADIVFKQAKSMDAQQDTPSRIEDFTLIGVRR